mmetsp:Transcript_57226/g.64869  ORF Transcript_57226/g.64869 Transcript_57226/m.64869 type:complete len:345 (+) Transcript_57226:47-1081(+)
MTVIALSHISKPTHNKDEQKLGKDSVTKRKKKNKKNKKKKNDKEEEETSSKIKMPEEDAKNVAGARLIVQKKETVTIDDNEDEDVDDDDDENDDGELLAAAALWAGDGDGETSDGSNDPSSREEDTRNNHPFSSFSPVTKISSTTAALQTSLQKQVYSLHITQLPYDSTEFDLRKLFAEHGCSKIKSIRLVYDHDTRGQKTVFRGVAFIDLLDSNSYEVALKLHHKTSIRGRKLNIRPCRSKEELAEIVSRTKELVQEKIRQQRSLERGGESGVVVGKSSSSANRNDQKIAVNSSQSNKRKTDGRTKSGRKKAPKVDAGGKPIKLTKKERNRRAAVIMSLKRKR